jgi:uncharacterized protein HemY
MTSLITPEDLEAMETTWHQLCDSLKYNNRAIAIAYAKQHIACIYETIMDLKKYEI